MIHNLSLNSPVFVICERYTSQSRSWEGPYKLFSILNKFVIIKLSSDKTQFCLTLVKLYDNLILKTDKNLDKDIKDISLERGDNSKPKDILPIYLFLNTLLALVFSTLLETSIPLSI